MSTAASAASSSSSSKPVVTAIYDDKDHGHYVQGAVWCDKFLATIAYRANKCGVAIRNHDGKVERALPCSGRGGALQPIAVSPDMRLLVVANNDDGLVVYDTQTWQPVTTAATSNIKISADLDPREQYERCHFRCFGPMNPNKKLELIAATESGGYVWDLDMPPTATATAASTKNTPRWKIPNSVLNKNRDIKYRRDGATVVACACCDSLTLLDTESQSEAFSVRGVSQVRCVDWMQDNRHLLFSDACYLFVFDTELLEPKLKLKVDDDHYIYSLAICPFGDVALVGTNRRAFVLSVDASIIAALKPSNTSNTGKEARLTPRTIEMINLFGEQQDRKTLSFAEKSAVARLLLCEPLTDRLLKEDIKAVAWSAATHSRVVVCNNAYQVVVFQLPPFGWHKKKVALLIRELSKGYMHEAFSIWNVTFLVSKFISMF